MQQRESRAIIMQALAAAGCRCAESSQAPPPPRLSVCLSADRFVEQSIYFFGRCITIGVTAPLSLSLSLSLSLFIFVRRAARARVMYMVIYSGAAATRERVLIICRTLNRGKYSGERSRTASSSCAFPYILLCVGT